MNKTQLFTSLITATALCGYSGAKLNLKSFNPETIISYQECTTNNIQTPDLNLTSKAAFLLEANSGEILFEHHANDRLPIASMTKIATLGVIYEALANNQINMDDMVLISDYAASMGGSQAFLDAGSEYSVRELIKSIVVASANDSCVALAEKIAGSVNNFVIMMNDFAKNVGCQNTNFVNCTGLPATNAYSCARDIAKMYARIMQSPHYGDFNQVWMYDFIHPSGRITGLTNTNKLIRSYPGCLGGKTGYTKEAGHCLTVTAKNNDLQPIAVIIGAPDSKTRFQESKTLLDYACQNFTNKMLIDKNQPVTQVKVKNANIQTVAVYPANNYYKLLPKGDQSNLTIAYEIPETIAAPINNNGCVGKIMVLQDGKVIYETSAITLENIKAASYWDTVKKMIHHDPL